ncbi:MAG: D-alanine--D-alanine ligase [Acidimicrobiia bacterium]|nr:D-alanine--D-alanine ligase [Acidimicrobiia bacterium]
MSGITRLVLIYGGPSAEHEVSCVSALHVSRAVDRSQFEVHVLGVSRELRWVDATEVANALPSDAASLPSPDGLDGLVQLPVPLLEAIGDGGTPPVVFPLIHGTMGEDGRLQGLLESSGVPYVGAGVLASALCMEKHVAKAVLRDGGLPQGDFRVVRVGDLSETTVEGIGLELGYPCFVKPSGQGSSVGVAKVDTADALLKALRSALEYGDVALVEGYIDGREIELAVLGNAQPRCTAPGEIVPSQDFYDYADKYSLGEAELLIPAPVPPDLADAARALALDAYRALEVEGFARVDLFLVRSGALLVNEVNTIPGFTPISMYPKLWEHEGLAYAELITELVELAHERFARHQAFRRSVE